MADSTKHNDSVKPETAKSLPPLCLACQMGLIGNHFLRNPGVPVTYSEVYYCKNHLCPRYGLLSIYKAREGVTT